MGGIASKFIHDLLLRSSESDLSSQVEQPEPHHRYRTDHDKVVHHPLGAGSYIFQEDLIKHLDGYCTKKRIVIQIGAQPNSSPHMGTIINFAVAFFLAERLNRVHGHPVLISLDLVDTAPSEQLVIDGVRYQRSQRFTREMDGYMGDFRSILDALHTRTGIEYRIRTQAEFLSDPLIPAALNEVVGDRDMLGPSFAPKTGKLAIRAACPRDGCALADKHGLRNEYIDNVIRFLCPHHGPHCVDLLDTQDIRRLEFNTPLRNLLRAKVFTRDPDVTWIRVTGADYAGYYQEQLMWRHIDQPLLIFYSPLIVDWSGAKLSKSLYVRSGAYQYLKDASMDYLLSFAKFKEQGKDLNVVLDEVEDWVDHPYKLFRSYSIAYIDSLFSGQTPQSGEFGT